MYTGAGGRDSEDPAQRLHRPAVLARLGRIDVLVIDDWAMAPLNENERREVWEICERKLPNPRISILSPARNERTTLSKMDSTMASLSFRVSSASRETSSIKSALVISHAPIAKRIVCLPAQRILSVLSRGWQA